MYVCVSLSEVFGKERCVPGAGGGSCGGSGSGEPAHRLCVTAAEEPRCSLAAHYHHHNHGLLSALWPQCCEMNFLFHFFSDCQWNPVLYTILYIRCLGHIVTVSFLVQKSAISLVFI